MTIQFSAAAPPRYTERSLPPYRHLPFQNPHPFLDADGHSYGEKLEPITGFSVNNWQQSNEYLYAIDLFNHGFWWEAHERLKHISVGAGRESETGQFVQGLIQVAAAMLKLYLKEEDPARTLADLGLSHLRAGQNPYLGIDWEQLADAVEDCLEDGDNVVFPVIHLLGFGKH